MSFIQVTWSQFCGWQKFTMSVLPLATVTRVKEIQSQTAKSALAVSHGQGHETCKNSKDSKDSTPPSVPRPAPSLHIDSKCGIL